MCGLRASELLLILAIVVILFGANRLPQIGAGLSEAIRGFKRALFDGGEKDSEASPKDRGGRKL